MANSLQIVRQFYPKVKQVVNAKKGLSVALTKRDVDAAKRKDHHGCAMVEACKRTLEIDGAIVSTRTAYLIKGDTAERYDVPERVTREITSFDRGAEFMPGEYELNKPLQRAPRGSGTRHAGNPRAGTLKHRTVSHHAIEGVRNSLPSMLPKGKSRPKRKK